jgi:transposase
MTQSMPVKFERYLALDIHKRYVVVGGVNAQQQVVLPQRRLDFDDWTSWLPAQVKRTDAVVIEATTNAWMFYDQLVPYAGRVVVANPLLVK